MDRQWVWQLACCPCRWLRAGGGEPTSTAAEARKLARVLERSPWLLRIAVRVWVWWSNHFVSSPDTVLFDTLVLAPLSVCPAARPFATRAEHAAAVAAPSGEQHAARAAASTCSKGCPRRRGGSVARALGDARMRRAPRYRTSAHEGVGGCCSSTTAGDGAEVGCRRSPRAGPSGRHVPLQRKRDAWLEPRPSCQPHPTREPRDTHLLTRTGGGRALSST